MPLHTQRAQISGQINQFYPRTGNGLQEGVHAISCPTPHSCCPHLVVCVCVCVCYMAGAVFPLTDPLCPTGSEGRGWAIKGQEGKQIDEICSVEQRFPTLCHPELRTRRFPLRPDQHFIFEKCFIKARVGSLSLASSCKNSIITFQHIVIQVVWKNTRLLHLGSVFRLWRYILANHGHFREHVFLLAVLHCAS